MPASSYSQTAYLFRADDGGESGCVAAQLAPLNTSPTGLRRGTNYRVRFGLSNSVSGAPLTTKLQVNKNNTSWVDADAAAPVKTTASSYIADGVATSQQITSGAFVVGEVEASAGNILNTTINFSSPNSSEIEFCFQISSAYASVGDTLQLRLAGLNSYSQTPSFVVAADPPPMNFSRSRNLRYGSRNPQ